MAGSTRLLRVVAHNRAFLMAVEYFDCGVVVQDPAALDCAGYAVAQLGLHPLFAQQGLGLLECAFFCVVSGLWGRGNGA